jgi:hypothetical protein
VGQQGARGIGRILGLDAEEDPREAALELIRRDRLCRDSEFDHRAGDAEAFPLHRRDMIAIAVDEGHVLARPHQMGADRPADGARAPDQDRSALYIHPVSMTSRVSSTATCQSAIISSSLR